MSRHRAWLGVCVAAALLGTALAGVAQAQETGTVRYWAVICGVANYKTINDLTYTDDDARGLAAALREYGVWQGPDQIEVLIDSAATENGIRAAIQRMGEKADAVADDHDVFLFFFSGHGMQVVDASGDESDGIDEAICPYDTQIRGTKVANIITDDQLGAWLAALPAGGEVVAILDTCFSGGMAKGAAVKSIRNPGLPPQARAHRPFGAGLARQLEARGSKATDVGTKDTGGAGTVVLMACQEGALSYETAELGNGVFSHFLIESLGNPIDGAPADVNQDDFATAEEAFGYAAPRTTDYGVNYSSPFVQVPALYDGNPAQDIVIVGMGAVPPPVAALTASPTSGPAPLTVSFTDESSGAIETWYWDFGDGTAGADQNPTHTYLSAGAYTVTLTVVGPGGTDSAAVTVIVVEPGAEVVTITKAEYKARKQELIVQATSTLADAVLTVEGYGEMTYNARTGLYTGQFKPVAAPGETVTVTSSEGGSSTAAVVYR